MYSILTVGRRFKGTKTDKIWTIDNFINKGTFGKIYNVSTKKNKNKFIIKLEKSTCPTIINELDKLIRLNNLDTHKKEVPLIIDFVLDLEINKKIFTGIIIKKYKYNLRNYKCAVNKCMISNFSINIIKALSFLDKHYYIHSDIKPENIVFDNISKPVIIDFGLCLFFNETKTLKTPIGTIPYMSFDAHLNIISRRTDITSFGFILCELLLNNYPLPWNKEKNLQKVYFEKKKFILNIPSTHILKKYFNIIKKRSPIHSPKFKELEKLLTFKNMKK